VACALRENVARGGYPTLLAGVNVTAQRPANAAPALVRGKYEERGHLLSRSLSVALTMITARSPPGDHPFTHARILEVICSIGISLTARISSTRFFMLESTV
jgi:hypothetical protein